MTDLAQSIGGAIAAIIMVWVGIQIIGSLPSPPGLDITSILLGGFILAIIVLFAKVVSK